jgi:hypothetical protein
MYPIIEMAMAAFDGFTSGVGSQAGVPVKKFHGSF